jgi:His/Glu/Gln/Arg/opine family amino acid ABC transporter permease subunit
MRRPRDWNRVINVVLGVAVVAVAVPWLWHAYRTRPPWSDPVGHYMLHVGLPATLRMAAMALAGSAVVGIVLGTLMTIRFWPSRAVIRLYVEVWRGLPIIVTLFLILFALPKVVHFRLIRDLTPFQAATIGLILWGSAQVAEATRGAVQSIPKEQHEAAEALGFGWIRRHRFVILPQALRRLLPPLIGLLVNVIQNTTVAALIGVAEVLETANRSRERLGYSTPDSHAFAIFGSVMLIFFLISFPLTRLSAYLERRMA